MEYYGLFSGARDICGLEIGVKGNQIGLADGRLASGSGVHKLQQCETTDGRSCTRGPKDTDRESYLYQLSITSPPFPPPLYAFALFYLRITPPQWTVAMPRSVSSESTTPSSPASSRKRLFSRAANLLSPNGKPGPLLDTTPPSVVRPSRREGKRSLSAIKTKLQAAGTPLKLLRRLSTSNAHLKPRAKDDTTPPLAKVKVKRGRGRSHSMYARRPPSLSRSHSGPGASSISQSRISPTIAMSDDASHKSAAGSSGITFVPHDVDVPVDLQTGIAMTKVSSKESKKVTVRLDADLGQIFYQSRRARISESLPPFYTP